MDKIEEELTFSIIGTWKARSLKALFTNEPQPIKGYTSKYATKKT